MATPRRSTGRPKNLLIEFGTEELPPKALKDLARSFAGHFFQGLVAAGVVVDKPANCRFYATPRRLAIWVKGVLPRQPDMVDERRGPSLQAAFDEKGNATAAAEGFARSCGVPVSRLKRRTTEKGAWLVFESRMRGKALNSVITNCLNASIRELPIPRRMRWGDGDEEFVRPVHWVLALYGSDPIRTGALGLKAGRFTRGHRFHAPGQLKILSADRYINSLKTNGFVIADFDARQAVIMRQVARLATKAGGHANMGQELLDEVTGLVEWPVALLGEFDERFLKLPREVLVSTMEKHQRYFSVSGAKGRLLPVFVAVSNIKSKSPKRVRLGNERVLRARLADAEFFWLTDQKTPLEDRIADLSGVLFHEKLGTIRDKSARIERLAARIARSMDVDGRQARRAARLCKTDLVTDMVGEFPELQGTIGKYYAVLQGEDRKVADAIDGHYQPRYSGDKLPKGKLAQCLALVDRVDTLAGIFACGEVPSGDRDPYGLRRAALGVLRILIEKKQAVDLTKLIRTALDQYQAAEGSDLDTSPQTEGLLEEFFHERLKGYFQGKGYSLEEISAVRAGNPKGPHDFSRRLKALRRFVDRRSSAAESLASANKRIANILAKAEDGAGDGKYTARLASEAAETRLARELRGISADVGKCVVNGDYDEGFKKLSSLKKPVDEFFDTVMVMHEDPAVRANRLALLAEIRRLFLGVADVSRLRLG